MDVGGKKLKVTKASIGPTQVANFDVGVAAISGLASQTGNEAEQSRVLQLLNMVTAEELMDGDEYEGILRPKVSRFECISNFFIQKFVRMSAKNAPSLAPWSTSRFRGHPAEADSPPVLARSLLNLTPSSRQRRH